MSLFYAVSALRVSGARIGALRGVGKAEKSGKTAGKAIQFQIQISNFEMAGRGCGFVYSNSVVVIPTIPPISTISLLTLPLYG
jgi:hypothetical protein